jgi:hypothetical protein
MVVNSTKASSRVGAWIVMPLTLALVVVIGFVYAALQQSYRQNANDPQIGLAGDIAAQMSAGSLPEDAVDTRSIKIDPRKSLATFGIIVTSAGNVTASSMEMDGATPLPPKGVLTAATLDHQNRITWQPERGARIALVVQAYRHDQNTGYVLVGRSLKEVETREDMLFWMAAVTGGAVVLLGGFALVASGRNR